MKNLFGITNIRVMPLEVNANDDMSFDVINEFLDEYNGNIIDIQYVGMFYGRSKVLITYKYKEGE